MKRGIKVAGNRLKIAFLYKWESYLVSLYAVSMVCGVHSSHSVVFVAAGELFCWTTEALHNSYTQHFVVITTLCHTLCDNLIHSRIP